MTSRTAASFESIPAWLVILLAAAWILPGLIGHDPWKPDEAYSFGLVYHILQTGDLVVPTLAGEPFMEKPPLFYLTAALFAKIFSGVLPLHDGARLASGFYIALTLLFTVLTARELYGQGRTAVLALLASLGLAPWAHLLITDTALLAGIALGLYGFAHGLRNQIVGGLLLGTGIGIAFLSKGLLGPGLLGITALVLPFLHRNWRSRGYLLSLLVAGVAALPWLLVWPTMLYLRSPGLFNVWIWDNNFGRFLGTSGLGPKQETLFYLRTLPWFAWPTWLLALWELWAAGRRGLRQPATLLFLAITAVTLAALLSASEARQVYILPLLLPLALLTVPAIENLPHRMTAALYVLGSLALFAVLALGWGLWWRQATDAAPLFSVAGLAAALYTAGCLYGLYATRHWRERALIPWTLAIILLLGLAMTLLLKPIDGQKSYRDVIASLKERLPMTYDCVASDGLGEPQRAMFEYYAGIRTLRRYVYPDAKCELLLRQEWVAEEAHDPREWRVLWEGQRPGDVNEKFRLYQRY